MEGVPFLIIHDDFSSNHAKANACRQSAVNQYSEERLTSGGKESVKRSSTTVSIQQPSSEMGALLNSLVHGMLIVDRGGTIRMNRAAAKLHGFDAIHLSHEQLPDYDVLFEFFDRDGKLVPRDAWPASRALRGEVVSQVELDCRSVLTLRTWRALYTATPIRDKKGRVQSAVVVIQEMTDRKTANADLERLASMVESSAVPMIGLTRNGAVESWNDAAESLFGYTAREMVGQPVAILGTCDRHNGVDTIRCVRSGGVVHNLETVRLAKDGRKVPVLLTIAPIKDHAGAVVAMSASVIDITKLKQVEDTLKETDRRKDEFLAVLAHELRNPLAPISNAVQILNLQASRDATSQAARNIIERQLQHLVRLVDDLLDVSRITRGKLELRRDRVLLSTALEQALEISMPEMKRSEHEVSVSWPSERIYLDADAVRLTQVFSNLLNNACSYTQKGGHIWMIAEQNHAHAVVRVKDNGSGISAENMPHVFDMFAQLRPPSQGSHDGLGIGLWLAKRLVELHDGSIDAKSDGAGKGSEFIVRLPVLEEKQGSRTEAQKTQEAPKALAHHRILVVDDNRDSAQSLAVLLRLNGNDVQIAYDGLQAVRKAEQYKPEVILLDIGMPNMNGYDVCRAIRQQKWGAEILIVAATGWGQENDRHKSKEAGFDGHLVKPIDHNRLFDLLRSLLQ